MTAMPQDGEMNTLIKLQRRNMWKGKTGTNINANSNPDSTILLRRQQHNTNLKAVESRKAKPSIGLIRDLPT
jgi:hypothetical protein